VSQIILAQQSSAPATPGASKGVHYIDNSTSPRMRMIDPSGNVYTLLDSSHNLWSAANSSTSTVSAGYATDTYLAGSAIVIPAAGLWKVGTIYRCRFDMAKAATASTATPIITVRLGTAGSTGDTTGTLAFTFGAGTNAADTGVFTVEISFRTIGSGTSAVIAGNAGLTSNLTATGLSNVVKAVAGVSSGFNSTTPTTIGVSFNGGTTFSGTCTLVTAELLGLGV
jgi:hypothetical protein